MERNKPIYQRRKPILDPLTMATLDPGQMTARQWLEMTELPNESQTREGAFRIATVLQRKCPLKVALVFNIVGSKRWFVGTFSEAEVRQILSNAQQFPKANSIGASAKGVTNE